MAKARRFARWEIAANLLCQQCNLNRDPNESAIPLEEFMPPEFRTKATTKQAVKLDGGEALLMMARAMKAKGA